MRRPWMIMRVNKLTQETIIKFGLELETTSSGKYYKVPSRCSFKDRLTTLIFFKKSWNFSQQLRISKKFFLWNFSDSFIWWESRKSSQFCHKICEQSIEAQRKENVGNVYFENFKRFKNKKSSIMQKLFKLLFIMTMLQGRFLQELVGISFLKCFNRLKAPAVTLLGHDETIKSKNSFIIMLVKDQQSWCKGKQDSLRELINVSGE